MCNQITINEKTNIEVTKIILNELNKSDNLIEFVKDRISHDKRYFLDCSKIKKLGWEPKHKFDNTLRQTIKWYAENKLWWTKVKKGEFKDYHDKQYVER